MAAPDKSAKKNYDPGNVIAAGQPARVAKYL